MHYIVYRLCRGRSSDPFKNKKAANERHALRRQPSNRGYQSIDRTARKGRMELLRCVRLVAGAASCRRACAGRLRRSGCGGWLLLFTAAGDGHGRHQQHRLQTTFSLPWSPEQKGTNSPPTIGAVHLNIMLRGAASSTSGRCCGATALIFYSRRAQPILPNSLPPSTWNEPNHAAKPPELHQKRLD